MRKIAVFYWMLCFLCVSGAVYVRIVADHFGDVASGVACGFQIICFVGMLVTIAATKNDCFW